jgi:hypothetical protein
MSSESANVSVNIGMPASPLNGSNFNISCDGSDDHTFGSNGNCMTFNRPITQESVFKVIHWLI